MSNPDRSQSQIADNRLAIAVVVGSLLVAAFAILIVRAGLIDALLPAHGPPADAAPLYLLALVAAVALAAWSWNRFLSWFQ
ncbi:hypothetical protein [Natronorubrum tibetense]|uniref:Uncharacterized protein n=1 Tax=Natronorubrum tibetense GA33 TaxID=1114856 RepID=L9W078_9EURY|nr:hypothetical protein [Natronorubrum tibetense]ELY42727.1 hypothetical protein C496_05312 [Natronorubrum tibetense GA33]